MNNENFEMTEEYQKESEFLLKRMQKREELVQLLKIAHPKKIAELRQVIAELDSVIEQTEAIMANIVKIELKKKEAEKHYAKLQEDTEKILPELLAHLKEHNPEAHDKLVANLKRIDEESDNEDE